MFKPQFVEIFFLTTEKKNLTPSEEMGPLSRLGPLVPKDLLCAFGET